MIIGLVWPTGTFEPDGFSTPNMWFTSLETRWSSTWTMTRIVRVMTFRNGDRGTLWRGPYWNHCQRDWWKPSTVFRRRLSSRPCEGVIVIHAAFAFGGLAHLEWSATDSSLCEYRWRGPTFCGSSFAVSPTRGLVGPSYLPRLAFRRVIQYLRQGEQIGVGKSLIAQRGVRGDVIVNTGAELA